MRASGLAASTPPAALRIILSLLLLLALLLLLLPLPPLPAWLISIAATVAAATARLFAHHGEEITRCPA
eukprot:COSAG06_NODE_950_length_11350_cov_12.434984_4_plen_69_part_00